MVGEQLKELRQIAGMLQTQIGELLGLTQASIQRYENNKAEAPYKVLLWYADYFDVSLDWIYGRCDKPQGKLYNYEPDALREKMQNKEEWAAFVKACFEPNSPLNAKLQEAILRLSIGGENNE